MADVALSGRRAPPKSERREESGRTELISTPEPARKPGPRASPKLRSLPWTLANFPASPIRSLSPKGCFRPRASPQKEASCPESKSACTTQHGTPRAHLCQPKSRSASPASCTPQSFAQGLGLNPQTSPSKDLGPSRRHLQGQSEFKQRPQESTTTVTWPAGEETRQHPPRRSFREVSELERAAQLCKNYVLDRTSGRLSPRMPGMAMLSNQEQLADVKHASSRHSCMPKSVQSELACVASQPPKESCTCLLGQSMVAKTSVKISVSLRRVSTAIEPAIHNGCFEQIAALPPGRDSIEMGHAQTPTKEISQAPSSKHAVASAKRQARSSVAREPRGARSTTCSLQGSNCQTNSTRGQTSGRTAGAEGPGEKSAVSMSRPPFTPRMRTTNHCGFEQDDPLGMGGAQTPTKEIPRAQSAKHAVAIAKRQSKSPVVRQPHGDRSMTSFLWASNYQTDARRGQASGRIAGAERFGEKVPATISRTPITPRTPPYIR